MSARMNESFRNRDHSVIREVLGIITFALAVYLFIIIISYSKDDPSLSSVGVSTANIKNLGGIVGSYISDVLLQAFGYGVYLFVLLLLFSSFRFIFLKSSKVELSKAFSVLAVVVSVSSFISLVFKGVGHAGYKPGGWVGDFIATTLYTYLSFAGALIVIVPCVILSIMMFGHISFIPLLHKTGYLFFLILGKVKEYYIKRLERAKKNKEVEKRLKIQKYTKKEEPKIISLKEKEEEKEKAKKEKQVQEQFGFLSKKGDFTVPPLSLLTHSPKKMKIDKESLIMNSKILEKKLSDYGVEGKVVQVHPGPVVTQFEYEPAPGVKVNKIVGLQDDLSMALRAVSIRIVAPIPGKSVVGIEIPNNNRETVHIKEVLESDSYRDSDSSLTLALGKDISGTPVCTSLVKMPHLLIAGATGSGKSVGLNTMISSILFKATPDDVRFIMIDPKMLELTPFEDIPHLLLPIVTDPKKAAASLRWAVSEMEKRYKIMSKKGVRNINSYNSKVEKELIDRAKGRNVFKSSDETEQTEELKKFPYIVVVIDELADLMVVASKEVEQSIARLAQMARAAGIHLILATQRPSVDVLTGLIKANFPARISFQVSARTDSRTILDSMGAERLLGHGDMLFLPPGTSKLIRVHGAYISDKEINNLTDFLREQSAPLYDEEVIANIETTDDTVDFEGESEYDEKYDVALKFVSELGHASISLIQRRFKIGYNRAARIIEQMEKDGVVGPSDGSKPRKVLISSKDY